MKKVLVLSLAAGLAAAAQGQQAQSAPQPKPTVSAADQEALNIARYKMALTDARKKLFAAGMSELTPQQLETFWGVYADFEKEKDAITGARGPRQEVCGQLPERVGRRHHAPVTESANLQKKTTDLRVKYFGILSQKLNAHAAGRFALIDDYTTTAARLNLLNQLPIPTGGTK
jgi:hypothetical protein